MYPNFLDQKSREVIEYSSEYILISVLHNLLQGECNPDLRLLGCSVLAPQCEKDKVIKPCRHVCENLKKNCLPAFDAIDMAWPYFLDCDRFFAGEEEGCFDPLAKLRGKEGSSADTSYPSGWEGSHLTQPDVSVAQNLSACHLSLSSLETPVRCDSFHSTYFKHLIKLCSRSICFSPPYTKSMKTGNSELDVWTVNVHLDKPCPV